MPLLKFVLAVLSSLAALPALRLVLSRRRHFELFVGAAQLLASTLSTAADALGAERLLLLRGSDWHFCADVLTETYVCLLGVHLCGLRSEDASALLRYCALAAVWWAKAADGWDAVRAEGVVLAAFILPAAAAAAVAALGAPRARSLAAAAPPPLRWLLARPPLAYDAAAAPRAALAALAGAALLAAEQRADTDARVGAALARVAFGAAAYYAWSAVPCYNKSDALPGFI